MALDKKYITKVRISALDVVHSNAHMSISTSTLQGNEKGYIVLLLVVAVASGQRVFGYWMTLLSIKS